VEFLPGKLMEALRPNPFDKLEEPTLNAAPAGCHDLHGNQSFHL
jgi:hypothetical protein